MAWKGKHETILREPLVKEWYEERAVSSTLSADVWLRNLDLFCQRMDTTPSGILELAKSGELRNLFKKFIISMQKDGKAGSYINKYQTMLNSFVHFHNIGYKLSEKVVGANKYKTVWGEHVPNQKELNVILGNGTPRGRVAMSLMAFSGLRPESIGNYEGTDGIRLKDIEEFNLDTLESSQSPTIITVRDNLSKTRDEYFTLIGTQGMEYIKAYLKQRRERGETLTKESPLLSFGFGHNNIRDMPRTLLVTREIRTAFQKSDFKGRPYILRRYFAVALDRAETAQYITHSWRQFIMGHHGDMESVYDKSKGNLGDDHIKDIRNSYKKCLELIETTPSGDLTIRIRREILGAIYGDDELKSVDVGNLTESEFNRMVKEKLPQNKHDDTNTKTMKSETVKQDDISIWEEKGYYVKCPLSPGYVLMVPSGYPL